jgi:hypothetical protein
MRSGSAILTAVWLLLAVVYPVPVMIEAPEETRALAVYVTRALFSAASSLSLRLQDGVDFERYLAFSANAGFIALLPVDYH